MEGGLVFFIDNYPLPMANTSLFWNKWFLVLTSD